MSLNLILSEGEKRYICGGIEVGMRSDGRNLKEYQLISCERNVAQNCDGSSHVRCGKNDVLVGVKLEIEEIEKSEDWTGSGRVDFFADLTANASPQFEGKQGEDICSELITLFSASIPQFLDLKSLVVVDGKSFWVIHIDIVILECGSRASLIDTVSMAVKTALYDTKIPKLTFEGGDSDEFAVCEDAFEAIRLDVSRVPLFVTLTRISNQYVIDVSREEEAGSISSVTFAVNQDDGIVYIKKLGVGSLHPDPFKENFKEVIDIGLTLNNQLLSRIVSEPDKSSIGRISF